MKGLSLLAPRIQFTPDQIITFTNLAWLPGPEYAMRFWAHCAVNTVEKNKDWKAVVNKPNVAITVFLGGEDEATGDASTAQEARESAIRLDAPVKVDMRARYTCPAWANTHYKLLFSQRASGKPGLLAWDRPEIILAGIRGLVKGVSKVGTGLGAHGEQPAESLEGVVVEEQTAAEGGDGGLKPPERPILGQGDSSRTRVGSPDGVLKPPERPLLEQGDSSQTQVGSQPPSSPKGTEAATMPSATAADDSKRQDGSKSGTPRPGTPDTIVMVTSPPDERLARP